MLPLRIVLLLTRCLRQWGIVFHPVLMTPRLYRSPYDFTVVHIIVPLHMKSQVPIPHETHVSKPSELENEKEKKVRSIGVLPQKRGI